MDAPIITIFVRHSKRCPHRESEQYRRCKCRKHLRWSDADGQHRESAGTRSWSEAEKVKRRKEDAYLTGQSIQACVKTFIEMKTGEGVSAGVICKYRRELGRLVEGLKTKDVMFPKAITLEMLIEYRATWTHLYPSSQTRQKVQERLKTFLRYLRDAGHVERVLKLSAIKVTEPPTMPLDEKQYTALLAAVPETFKDATQAHRVRALIRLMRHSGLAIQDASTIERSRIMFDKQRKLYRVITARTKTGTHVSVPLANNVSNDVLTVVNDNRKYIFWSGNGTKETMAKHASEWFRRLRVKAGLTSIPGPDGGSYDFHGHMLRDKFAVDLLTQGVDLQIVSELLGHKSIRVTEKHYKKWVPKWQSRLDDLVTATNSFTAAA
jgi:integrase/recombinase XerD